VNRNELSGSDQMMRTHGLIGVPSSAGAHYPGQEKTPAALRDAGIEDRLTRAGISITDYGDLPLVVCRVDPNTSHSERVADVRSVAGGVADYVERIVAAQQVPLVIGGDCTITIGVVAGFVRSQPDLALLYIDGGLDAVTPPAYRLGRLDSTGLAHLVAEPDCEPTLSEMGSRYPLMAGKNIVPFGYAPGEPPAAEQEFLMRHGIRGYSLSVINGETVQAAMEARSRLERQAERFLVHFDVDVIDFIDFPAADVLQPKRGLKFTDAFAALRVFCVSPKFGGLIVTEFNPDHDDKNGILAKRLIDALARTISSPSVS
jgi:arginase